MADINPPPPKPADPPRPTPAPAPKPADPSRPAPAPTPPVAPVITPPPPLPAPPPSAPPAVVTPGPSRAAIAGGALVVALVAAALGFAAHLAYSSRPGPVVAHAAITAVGGGALEARYAAGLPVILSAEKATATNLRWTVDPAATPTIPVGRQLIVVPRAGTDSILVHQLAIKGDTVDEVTVALAVDDAPPDPGPPPPPPPPPGPPTPPPGPPPGPPTPPPPAPPPDPTPAAPPLPEPPPGSFDPEVRTLSKAYWISYLAGYGKAAQAADYAAATQSIVDGKKAAGTPLGQRIDALTKALYDDQGRWKDEAQRKRAYGLIYNSLLGGLRDATLALLESRTPAEGGP